MADDILSRLRASVCWYNFQGTCFACEAADEIERLRTALCLAVGEMSTSGEYSYLSPEVLMQKFLEQARRG